MGTEGRRLATRRNLVTYHEDRSVLYRALGEVIALPPSEAALTSVLEILEAEPAARSATRGELVKALRGPSSAVLGEAQALEVRNTRCDQPASPHRAAAFSGFAPEDEAGVLAEVQLLAHLAHQGAMALHVGDVADAARLCATQHEFLQHHAQRCLEIVSASLRASTSRYFVAAGVALSRLVADDVAGLALGR